MLEKQIRCPRGSGKGSKSTGATEGSAQNRNRQVLFFNFPVFSLAISVILSILFFVHVLKTEITYITGSPRGAFDLFRSTRFATRKRRS
jgi:hypothetical protein